MTKTKDLPVYKRSLFSWVLSGKFSLQILLVLIILVIVFLRVLPLEIQKRIVNDVLALGNFRLLLIYCLIYLAAVLLSSALKFAINGLQTLIGQRALTEMRRDMYCHILRLPLSFFRKTQAGSVVASLVNELAASADFVGMAIAVPLSNILTLIAFAVYLIWLNPLLGVTTLSIYPIALFIVPLVQRGANKANKKRVDASRKMASQITESISGINEVHAQGSFQSEEKKYNAIIERLLRIRIIWSLYRYGVKVTNNLFVGLGPVIVLLLGGYLMMQGKTELGSIVAFLSAQEKLYDPWKELIEFYQVYQDASIRYKKVTTAFAEDSEFMLSRENMVPTGIKGSIEARDLAFVTTDGIRLLDQINLSIQAGEHVALVGYSGSGKSTLAKCIGQLYGYTEGELLLDGHHVSELSKEEIVRSVGFISQDPVIFSGTVSDNLLYSSRAIAEYSVDEEPPSEPSLDDKIAVLQQTGLFVDTLRFGLNSALKRSEHPELEEKFLRVRRNFQKNFGKELAKHVEFYNDNKYLYNSSIVENLIFGTPVNDEFAFETLAENRRFLDFLDDCSLKLPLLETGFELLTQTVDILGDVPREKVFFAQTPIEPHEYESYRELAEILKKVSIRQIEPENTRLLLHLAFRFIPALHKIIVLQPLLEKLVLNARQAFRDWSSDVSPGAVAFYKDSEYIHSQSILNNMFYGSLTTDSPNVQDRVDQCIVYLLIEEDLLEDIAAIGMELDVGSSGDNLSGGQQQKLAIARVLLKQPNLLIMDEATSALDNNSQKRIQRLVENWKGSCTVISVIHRLDLLSSFDKVAVMRNGKIIEWGEPEKLVAEKGVLYELIHGKGH
jgi:ABC-type bacteriocin/lantibiotic exporter with double-glycine peptidase domain